MPKFIVIREHDDPICKTRISIGVEPGTGSYFVYRGTIEDARKALDIISKQIKDMPEQPIGGQRSN